MFTRMKMFSVMLCLAGLSLTTTGIARASDRGFAFVSASRAGDEATTRAAVPMDDQQLTVAVLKAINRSPNYDIFDWVDPKVEGGVVTLTGEVRQPWHGTEYAKAVQKLSGVKQVKNELRVLPVSGFDNDIRRVAARAIYGDSMFTIYAMQANPPIHIIVEYGRVALKGAVLSTMDKQLVETKVRNAVLAFEVSSQLQVDVKN